MNSKCTLCALLALLMLGCGMALTGCASPAAEPPDDDSALSENSKTDEAPGHSSAQTAEAKDDTEESPAFSDAVTLLIYGGWNEEEDIKNDDTEYTLSNEHSELIIGLFTDHEREPLDSPTLDAVTLQFQIGEDHLATSMGSRGTLSGRIGGELVAVTLNESEWETVQQIISAYAQDVL